MAGSVVRTGSEPEPDPMELNLVQFQVRPTPPNLTSVQFGVLSFQSKNRTEPDYGNTMATLNNITPFKAYYAITMATNLTHLIFKRSAHRPLSSF